MDEEISEELDRKGQAIYEVTLRSQLEAEFPGSAVAIHIDSGDYATDRSWSSAVRHLRQRQPYGLIFVRFIGDPTPAEFTLGARLTYGNGRRLEAWA